MIKDPSKTLTDLIQQTILARGGTISFAQFMDLALYTPQLGYYASLKPKFGKAGDFFTAPELSSDFAKCIARQAAQIKSVLATEFDILEIGAGSGKLALDCLLALEKLGVLPHHYYIVEISEALREQQRQYFQSNGKHLLNRVQWLDNIPKTPQINGLIIANEVLDAFPVHCFQIEGETFSERCVNFDQDFCWQTIPATNHDLIRRVNLIRQECPLPEGYQSEVNLKLYDFIPALSLALKRGVILISDYGYGRREYYHPDRSTGTLRCFYRHHASDNPFQHLGEQDITAHVDFTAVIESAIGADLRLGGFTTQSSFLLSCGLLEMNQHPEHSLAHYQQNQAIKKLTMPSQMGELIKVMALTKAFREPLLGFQFYDRKRSL